MNITQEELAQRLNWTLSQKIDHSLYIIDSALSYCNNNAYVSFSGGKDSTVLLSLVKLIKPNIKIVFFNTTNEFPEIYKFIKEFNCITIQPEINLKKVIEKYGFPLISKEQAQYIREARHTKSKKLLSLRLNGRKSNQGKISNKWQHLIYAPFEISEKCCYWLKKRPAIKFEKENKLLPFIGTNVNESTLRKQKYLSTGCNAFELNHPASYPLSIWTTENIWDYIKQNNIPYCNIYDKGETQTGCMICGFGCHKDNRFKRLEESYPRVFEIGMNFTNNNVTYKEAIRIVLKLH
jgi:3'-phosphoadenosine 5'-phosphosulfate sulfotransferase (PAPS reductase)/FAD synthetase